MKTKIIKTTEELVSIKNEWNALLKNSYKDVVQLTHEWIITWWNSFGNGNQLNVIAVYGENGQLVGIAPMMRANSRYRGVNITKTCLMANGQSPSSNFIVSKENSGEIIKAILDYLKGHSDTDIIEFTKLDTNSQTYSIALDYLNMNSNRFGIKDNIEAPFISINSDWEAFLSNKSQRFRKSLRNKINRANKSGGISIEKIQINDSNNPAIQEMFAVSGKSWKRQEGTDITSNPHSKNFYIEICDRLGPQGIISLWLLRKEGIPIAIEFHLTYNNVVYPIRADYDESFSDLSPGSVLEYNIIKTLFDEGKIKEYNTCGHTYNYLMNWSDDTRKHANIEIFSKNYKSYGLYNLEYKLIPFLRKLRLNKVKQQIMNLGTET